MKAEVCDVNPLVNLPLLDVNGQFFSESKAILRYVGRIGKSLAGKNDIEIMKSDQTIDFTEDFYTAFGPSFSLPTIEEKIAARQVLLTPEGQLTKLLIKAEKYIKSFGSNKYVCGDYITVGDLALWSVLCLLCSSFLDGIPTNIYDNYPVIESYRKFVGSHPQIVEHYKDETAGLTFIGYKV